MRVKCANCGIIYEKCPLWVDPYLGDPHSDCVKRCPCCGSNTYDSVEELRWLKGRKNTNKTP